MKPADRSTSPVGTEALDAMEAAERYHAYIAAEVERAFAGYDTRIVDFGAGTGTVARLLCREGRKLICVEPDDAVRARLAAAGLDAVAALEEIEPRSVQSVLLVNVLEHIADDVAVLRAIRERMVAGGRLFVWVPAGDWLYSPFDAGVGHVRRYSRGNLARTIEHAGFEILVARYTDPLGAVAAALYKIGSGRGGEGELSSRSVAIFDRFVFPVSRRLQKLTGRFSGKNLLVVARAAGDDRADTA